MYKLGSFSKNVIICLIVIIQCLFKKSLKWGKFERGGANLNSSGTTLKKCRPFEKIMKIYGSNDEKHFVKKYENMLIFLASTGGMISRPHKVLS